MSRVIPTNHFKKQRKEVKKNPRWHNIFHGGIPFPDDHRLPWEYIINCSPNDEPIPDYSYEHPVTLTVQQKNQIKNRLGSLSQVEVKGLDLHFGGYNGDHLLLYIRTSQGVVCLVGIGTRSDLF